MHNYNLKPSLDAMPPELLRLFVSDPVTSHGFKVDGVHGSHDPHWLAIRQDWSRRDEDFTAKETLATLRSLSQTCKSLRVFALPLLWTICQVKTVEELGRLRETLRASPAIASHVRHFSFSWNMGGDYYKCDEYEAKEGTLLDLAFRNRCELWNSLRAEAEGRMLNEFKRTHDRNFFQSKVAGMKPGWAPPRSADAVLLHHSAEHEDDDSFDYYSDDGEEDYYWSVKGSGAGGDGPDGRGEDRLVKSVSDFNSCLVEIVAQLGSLTTFGWAAEAAAMPMGVLESLEKLTTLSHLHLSLSGARGTVHALPFWRLVPNLKTLEMRFTHTTTRSLDDTMAQEHQQIFGGISFAPFNGSKSSSCRDLKEQHAENLLSFELPSAVVDTDDARQALHSSIACRTIIAAARTGRLRKLVYDPTVELPFAIRELLPCWVAMEHWKLEFSAKEPWPGAAVTLRPILAHASLWHDTAWSLSSKKRDRRLSRQDIQSLHSIFEAEGVPTRVKGISVAGQPITLYLPWLQDSELAQKVADAWNSVVERGEVDVVKCSCAKCEGKPSSSTATKNLDLGAIIRALAPYMD